MSSSNQSTGPTGLSKSVLENLLKNNKEQGEAIQKMLDQVNGFGKIQIVIGHGNTPIAIDSPFAACYGDSIIKFDCYSSSIMIDSLLSIDYDKYLNTNIEKHTGRSSCISYTYSTLIYTEALRKHTTDPNELQRLKDINAKVMIPIKEICDFINPAIAEIVVSDKLYEQIRMIRVGFTEQIIDLCSLLTPEMTKEDKLFKVIHKMIVTYASTLVTIVEKSS